jgi:hypothetical protein
MKSRVGSLLALFLAVYGFHGKPAWGWGHLKGFHKPHGHAHLVFDAIFRKRILYCIQIGRVVPFRHDSLQIQIEKAIRVWLEAAGSGYVRETRLKEVPCSDPELDLMLQFQVDSEYPGMRAYQKVVEEQARAYSRISFNTAMQYADGGHVYRWIDFSSLVPKGVALADSLHQLSGESGLSLHEFAEKIGVDYHMVRFSTYPVLIHELGHSLGLCDLEGELFEKYCDPAHRTELRPSSVMLDCSSFFLKEDDVAGIRALFERFAHLKAATIFRQRLPGAVFLP